MEAVGCLGFIFFAVAGCAIYFLPTLVAALRNHPNMVAIFVLDLFLGWTLVGWVASLVWAVTAIQQPPPTVPQK